LSEIALAKDLCKKPDKCLRKNSNVISENVHITVWKTYCSKDDNLWCSIGSGLLPWSQEFSLGHDDGTVRHAADCGSAGSTSRRSERMWYSVAMTHNGVQKQQQSQEQLQDKSQKSAAFAERPQSRKWCLRRWNRHVFVLWVGGRCSAKRFGLESLATDRWVPCMSLCQIRRWRGGKNF